MNKAIFWIGSRYISAIKYDFTPKKTSADNTYSVRVCRDGGLIDVIRISAVTQRVFEKKCKIWLRNVLTNDHISILSDKCDKDEFWRTITGGTTYWRLQNKKKRHNVI